MNLKMKNFNKKELFRITLLGFLLLFCILTLYYFHVILRIEIVYTHLFYVPIVLACLWWQYKGLAIAVFLAMILLISHAINLYDQSFLEDVLRGLMFIIIGTVVAFLSNKRLILTGKLQELDRIKTMFIANMSHELRTPLNSIIGFTGVILQGLSGEITSEQRKQLILVKNSSNHLLALINDIIDVSKIEADQIELVIEEFNLSNLMQEVNDYFKVAVKEKGLKLSFEMSERLIIKSDERRAKQVIMNLVSNAIKFTDTGEIKIKATKKDERVYISVRDTGIGIEKKDMDKLFKAFSRIYTKDMLKEGTGLGLYLSRKIANLLRGDISVESEFGKWSEFTFSLPLKYKEVYRDEKNTGD